MGTSLEVPKGIIQIKNDTGFDVDLLEDEP